MFNNYLFVSGLMTINSVQAWPSGAPGGDNETAMGGGHAVTAPGTGHAPASGAPPGDFDLYKGVGGTLS